MLNVIWMAHLEQSESQIPYLPQPSCEQTQALAGVLKEEKGSKMQQRAHNGRKMDAWPAFIAPGCVWAGGVGVTVEQKQNIPELGLLFFPPQNRPLLFLIRPELTAQLLKLDLEWM